MPRYKTSNRYQVGEYWLDKKPHGSDAWHRVWFDAKTRQTKRVSLRTTDFEEAKQKLNDWFLLNQRQQDLTPEDVPIAQLLARYWEEYGKNLRSIAQTKVSIKYWVDFYEDRTVNDLRDIQLQEEFHRWLLAKGMKASTVSRVITSGRSAINRAWKRGELSTVPFIADIDKSHRQAAPPRGRPLEIKEVRTLFENAHTATLRSYIAWLLATGARREAVMDLTLDRCDVKNRLIQLNPPERVQTTKHRPSIRLPEVMVPLVKRCKAQYGDYAHVVGLKPTPMDSLHRSWNLARDRAGFDKQVNSYSLRHTVSRELSRREVSSPLCTSSNGLNFFLILLF